MKYTKKTLGSNEEKEIIAHNVRFQNGFEVEVLNLGGVITKIITPDKYGKLENIVVGYKDIEGYIENPSYMGAIIGRTAGRINNGEIEIEGKKYILNKNYNPHQGHGGDKGFSHKFWNVEVIQKEEIVILKLSLESNDGQENYPGNVKVNVSFKIYEGYKIEQTYNAVTDKTTLMNMTNHSYFNLSGNIKRPITEHDLMVSSQSIVELDNTCVPTGNVLNVNNGPFDFRQFKNIGKDIDSSDDQIKIGSGYDHIFLLNGDKNIVLKDSYSGRKLSITTNQESVVIYTMNFPDNIEIYNGKTNQRRYGICFETQAPPIGMNMCYLEKSILKIGDIYNHKTIYSFGIEK